MQPLATGTYNNGFIIKGNIPPAPYHSWRNNTFVLRTVPASLSAAAMPWIRIIAHISPILMYLAYGDPLGWIGSFNIAIEQPVMY